MNGVGVVVVVVLYIHGCENYCCFLWGWWFLVLTSLYLCGVVVGFHFRRRKEEDEVNGVMGFLLATNVTPPFWTTPILRFFSYAFQPNFSFSVFSHQRQNVTHSLVFYNIVCDFQTQECRLRFQIKS